MAVFNSFATWAATFRLPGLKMHAGYFRVFIIHRTLTWTTGYVTCVRGLSYACVCTRVLGTPTASQHNLFDSEKLKVFLVLLTGLEPSTNRSPVQRSKPLSQPATPLFILSMDVSVNHTFTELERCLKTPWEKLIQPRTLRIGM